MTRILFVVALSMLVTYPASATSFWLSPFGNGLGSTQPTSLGEIPTLYNFAMQGTGSVYIWAETDPNQTLKNWSLRVVSSNAGVLSFTTSTVYNPTLGTPGNVRWEYIIDPISNSSTSKDFMGFTITNDPNNDTGLGIGPNTATDDQSIDPLYYGPNDGSGSWLLAKLDYSFNPADGMTNLFLEIGLLGLNNDGQTSIETNVTFGHVGDSVGNAGEANRHTSTMTDATVQVYEPDADFDNDTFVTGADFLIWQRNSGQTGLGNSDGNATVFAGDTDVNGVDLAAWELQYGMMITPSVLFADSSTVPEPATWALACLAFSVLLARSRRRLPR